MTRNNRAMSKVAVLILLIISFLLGSILSYIWTMGFYAPAEYNLPSKSNVSVENVEFFVEDPTYFNVTVLNPSYSPSAATIREIKTETADGQLHNISSTSPSLPRDLQPSQSETFRSDWNWGNYTNQKINVLVFIADGSGAIFETTVAFMNLTVTKVTFEPSVTVTRFNITVESTNSPVKVDVESIFVNGIQVSVRTPQVLPFTMNPNESVTFTLNRNWTDLQNKTVTVRVDTLQGYTAIKTVLTPLPVSLIIQSVVFDNTTSTQHFNVTVLNETFSPAAVSITSLTIQVRNTSETITNITRIPPEPLQPGSSMLLIVFWDWSQYQGTSAQVIINVLTDQGFMAIKEAQIT